MTAGYENLARFRPGPGADMISGATLLETLVTGQWKPITKEDRIRVKVKVWVI